MFRSLNPDQCQVARCAARGHEPPYAARKDSSRPGYHRTCPEHRTRLARTSSWSVTSWNVGQLCSRHCGSSPARDLPPTGYSVMPVTRLRALHLALHGRPSRILMTSKGQGLHCADLRTGTVASESDHLRCCGAVQREARDPRSPGGLRCRHMARCVMNPTGAPTTAVMFGSSTPCRELCAARHRPVHVRRDIARCGARRSSQASCAQRHPQLVLVATTLTFG